MTELDELEYKRHVLAEFKQINDRLTVLGLMLLTAITILAYIAVKTT